MKSPVIIMGTGRSGTSVFTRLLGLHENLWAFRWETQIFSGFTGYGEILERRFNPHAINQFLDSIQGPLFRRTLRKGQPSEYDAGLFEIISEEKLEQSIEIFKEDIESAANRPSRTLALNKLANSILEPPAIEAGASRWCEKTPRNLLYADLIAEVFPDAKFINVVRDGRDVASSMVNRNFWPIGPSSRFESTSQFRGEITIDKCAHYWSSLMQIGIEMEEKLGKENCLTIRFEDLINKREETFRTILNFLGESYDDAVLDKESKIIRAGNINIQRWKDDLSLEQQNIFENIAKNELKQFGYTI